MTISQVDSIFEINKRDVMKVDEKRAFPLIFVLNWE